MHSYITGSIDVFSELSKLNFFQWFTARTTERAVGHWSRLQASRLGFYSWYAHWSYSWCQQEYL